MSPTQMMTNVPLSTTTERSTTVRERHMLRIPMTARAVLRSPSPVASGLVSGTTAVMAVMVATVLLTKNRAA